jgi:hypothetical protein
MKRYVALTVIAALIALIPDLAQAQVTARGRITLLRVHDVTTAFGPPNDRIDVEVVVTLDTQPGKAFGFQLRTDPKLPARQAMLDLLRDAYASNQPVSFDHITPAGKNNGLIIRVWLSR